MLILPDAPSQYDAQDQAQLRGALKREDKKAVKVGDRPRLQSPNGTWWEETIDNAGTVTWTALA